MSKNKMIIEFGGKQHLAEAGTRIVVNQDNSSEGETITAKDLFTGDDVKLKVVKNFLGKKLNGMKFKSKSRYTRRYGHRQNLMILEVMGSTESKPKPAKKAEIKKVAAPKKKTPAKVKAGTK